MRLSSVIPLTISLISPLYAEMTLKGAIHVHSLRSFDSQGTFEEMKEAAKLARLDFILLTDHVATKKRGVQAALPSSTSSLLWIDGAEVIVKDSYSLLALGSSVSQVNWKKGKEIEGVKTAKEKGALVFLDHFWKYKDFQTLDFLDGVALYNTHVDSLRPWWRLPKLFYLATLRKNKPHRLWLNLLDPPEPEIKIWERLSEKAPLAAIASNDAHQNVKLFGHRVDPYAALFNFVNTYVLAQERTEAAILYAIKEGKSYLAFSFLGNPQGFEWKADSGQIAIKAPQGTPSKIRLFHNGTLKAEEEKDQLTLDRPAKGAWRCEIWIKIGKKWKPWIYSNMVHVG